MLSTVEFIRVAKFIYQERTCDFRARPFLLLNEQPLEIRGRTAFAQYFELSGEPATLWMLVSAGITVCGKYFIILQDENSWGMP